MQVIVLVQSLPQFFHRNSAYLSHSEFSSTVGVSPALLDAQISRSQVVKP
jgi:hypothetical protein